jgi:hypothetical protein
MVELANSNQQLNVANNSTPNNSNQVGQATNNLNTKSASVGCLSQITFTYQIKVAKQKQFINGILYSLQEIYGIEKKCSDLDVNAASSAESETNPNELIPNNVSI